LPVPTLADQNFGFTRDNGKRESGQDIALTETDTHVIEGENPLARGVQGRH